MGWEPAGPDRMLECVFEIFKKKFTGAAGH